MNHLRKLLFSMLLVSTFGCGFLLGQTKVYFFPGQGSDERIFQELEMDSTLVLYVIKYPSPRENETLQSFALRLSNYIDTTGPFVLVGVSFGGMICAELHRILHPNKTILISSATSRKDLPTRYRVQNKIGFYSFLSGEFLHKSAKFLQPIVEPDRNKKKEIFKSMLAEKEANYMKQTLRLIVEWDRLESSPDIIQIHGTKDHTLPFRNINKVDYIIPNGSHMMTLTRAKEISEILNAVILLPTTP